MKRLPTLVMAFLMLICIAGTAWSKGAITRIVIDGGRLSEPVEITDPAMLDKFTIWSGPGVDGWDMATAISPSGMPKFIADWSKGVVSEQPRESIHYFVRMYIEGREAPRNTYEVLYVIDSDAGDGYVYLPSSAHDDFGQWNTYQIYRDVEGNWFRSTQEWDEVVRPLVDAK